MQRPIVVRNLPELTHEVSDNNSHVWRKRFGIGSLDLIFIYQGLLSPGRRIEQFLRVFARVQSNRHLVIMGYGSLEAAVRAAVERYPNIHFAPAVAPAEVVSYAAGADVGLVGVENICLSYYYSLPNKLFDYLHAGLPVIMPDYPEMAAIVRAHGCGWVVAEDDAAWVAQIDGLKREDILRARNTVTQARANYSWASEQARVVALMAAQVGAASDQVL